MNQSLDFLEYVIPTIVVIGWMIGLVQANKVNGQTHRPLHAAIMAVYTLALLANFYAQFSDAKVLLPVTNLLIAAPGIFLVTHFYNKKEYFVAGLFCLVAIIQGLLFFANIYLYY